MRWFAPASPATQATGTQLVDAVVRGRVEMLVGVESKVAAASAASARNVTSVASLCDSLAANWT